MSVEVKICGIKNARALDAALEAGADYFGLVFFAASPRSVTIEDRAGVGRARRRSCPQCRPYGRP